MNSKIKHFLQGVVFFILLSVSVYFCGEILESKRAYQKYNDFFEAKTNYDVIFLGTSHTQNSIFPMELWKDTGISSYNWGFSNCTPAENYYLFKDIIKYTDCKLVVIDLYGLFEYPEGNGKYRADAVKQQHVQFDEIPFSLNKLEAIMDIFDDYENRLDFLFNLMIYHDRWSELSEQDYNASPLPEKGAEMLVGNIKKVEVKYSSIGDSLKRDLDSVCCQYLEKFLQFCADEDIPVLCTYLPFPAQESHQRAANSVDTMISRYQNAEYINMLNMGIVDYSTDLYYDGSHLNYMGSLKVTDWLGSYISENYALGNYSESSYWIDSHKEYVEYKLDKIKATKSLYDKLLLCYGGDFKVHMTMANTCELYNNDKHINGFIRNLEQNCTVSYEKEVMYDNVPCDVSINIYNASNGELAHAAAYRYDGSTLEFVG